MKARIIRAWPLLCLFALIWTLIGLLWATAGEAQSRVEWQEVSPAWPPASVDLVAIRGADHVAELRISNEVQHPYGTVEATLVLGELAVDIEIDVTSGPDSDLYIFEVTPGFVIERRSLELPDREAAVVRIWRLDANMM